MGVRGGPSVTEAAMDLPMPSPFDDGRPEAGASPSPCATGDIPGDRALAKALDGLEDDVPDRVARAIRWLRDPTKRWIRLPMGVAFVIGGLLWFLPVLGLEMLPIGLLLIAVDVPVLRKPVGSATLWLECQWNRLRRHWRNRRRQ